MKTDKPTLHNSLSNDLQITKTLFYDKFGIKITAPQIHPESKEYEACTFALNNKVIEYRLSKITPTKVGQFVSIWKRNQEGITAPFDVNDDFDFMIIASRNGEKFGQFIFPKAILASRGIITGNGKAGKRGFRVYPPWDRPTSKQAYSTQAWQTQYFLEFSSTVSINLERFNELFANFGVE